MSNRHRVTADDIEEAVDGAVAALSAGATGDWAEPAGELAWDCRRTAVHVADCLMAYAAQVAAGPADHWVPFSVSAPRKVRPADLLELVTASGGILAATVGAATRTARAWHPYGVSDPEGFSAMAVTETLVHGADIAAGLSIPFEPSSNLCRRTVARLFPEVGDQEDPWALLRWATGRIALPDRPRRRSWRWHGEPIR
ncbi:MAG TPA: hypothetical protein VGB64_00670 [Actinomycetota bacterium]